MALRAQGRLQEALPAMRASLRIAEEAQDWTNAAICCVKSRAKPNCSSATSPPPWRRRKWPSRLQTAPAMQFQMMVNRATQADALARRWRMGEGRGLFADAERRQQASASPKAPPAVLGCRVSVLRPAAVAGTGRRGARPGGADSEIGASEQLGSRHRARHSDPRPRPSRPGAAEAWQASLRPNRRASMRAQLPPGSMRPSKACAPRGKTVIVRSRPLARAAFRRAIGDWDGAKSDLDEAKEIAEPGLMRLYWCDCALEGARLALARREAFAPLNGLVEPSPPPPVLPDRRRGGGAQGGSAEGARRRAQAHRRMRLPSPRRGTRRARRGRRRRPPLRRPAAPRLRRGAAIASVCRSGRPWART